MSVETPKFIAAVGRMIRAAGRRAGEGDEPELQALIELQAVLTEAIGTAIGGQLAMGKSWEDIAAGTRTKKQTAWERWRKHPAVVRAQTTDIESREAS